MRARSEQESIVASFSEEEAAILRAAAEQIEGIKVVDIPRRGEIYVNPNSGQEMSVKTGNVVVELKAKPGKLDVLFERADQLSAELARTSSLGVTH